MVLLLLMGLGTAGLKAQVRIGSNTPPNASAVLDLNANDTNNGTLGLALPRVALTSNTMLLSGVTSNLTGMMVYNTSTAGGTGVNTMGIYYWNGATWVKTSLPSTSAADSGKVLLSNGSTWVPSDWAPLSTAKSADTLTAHPLGIGFSIAMILDTAYYLPISLKPFASVELRVVGMKRDDWCFATSTEDISNSVGGYAWASSGSISYMNLYHWTITTGAAVRLRCLRLVSK